MVLTLYSSWRASAPYRVRIGLSLKGLAFDTIGVDLATDRQREPAYVAVNAQALVPTLDLGDGRRLTQSLAILEYLDETHPQPPLLPADPVDRARVRALCSVVACDIHPVNNRRIMQALAALGANEAALAAWTERWIGDGFDTLEPLVARDGRGYAFGAHPTLADCCLVPQANNARRAKMDLDRWPAIHAAVLAAEAHPAIAAAHPSKQPDAA